MSEEEELFSSGDEAVHAFLNELHEYKIRSVEKQKDQAEKFSTSSKKIKVKRKRESLFKSAAKRKEELVHEEAVPVHKCQLTREERRIARRNLYNPDDEAQAKSRRHKSDWGRPEKWPLFKQRADHNIILSEKLQEGCDRLFNASKECYNKKTLSESAVLERDDDAIQEGRKPKSNPTSLVIAQKRFHSTIEDAFKECSASIQIDKFNDILAQLGISSDHKHTRAFIKSVRDSSESVDGATAKAILCEAIDGVDRTTFHTFARQSMICHSASAKKEFVQEDEPKSPTKKMTPETLDRLCDLHPKKMEEKEPASPPPKKPPARKWHDPEPIQRPQEVQELHEMSIDERERVLIERKRSRLEKLREIIASEQNKRLPRPVMPEYSEQTKQDIQAWKKKREEEERLSQPTWTPKLTKYEDYLKKKKELESAKKPHGWDESVARHRMAIEAGRKKRQRNTEL